MVKHGELYLIVLETKMNIFIFQLLMVMVIQMVLFSVIKSII